MSETVFRFFSNALTTLRIHCGNATCGAVLEVTPEKAVELFRAKQCPVCRCPIGTHLDPSEHPILKLAKALQEIAHPNQTQFRVEFVLPVKE